MEDGGGGTSSASLHFILNDTFPGSSTRAHRSSLQLLGTAFGLTAERLFEMASAEDIVVDTTHDASASSDDDK